MSVLRSHPVAIVFAVTLLLGWFAVATGQSFFLHSVSGGLSDEYDEIAVNLLEHGRYSADPRNPEHLTVTRGPAYPLWLAGLLTLTGSKDFGVVGYADLALHAATAAALAALLLPLAGPGAALAGGLAYAFWPTTFYYAAKGSSETLLNFWLAVSLLALARLLATRRSHWAFALGASLGLAALTRGSAAVLILLAGVAVLGAVALRRLPARAVVLAAVAGLLVLSPWWVRNYRVTETFVPFHSLLWYNAYHDDVFDGAQRWLAAQGMGHVDWGRVDPARFPASVPRHPEGFVYPSRLPARDDLAQEARYRSIMLEKFRDPGYLAGKVARNAWDFWSAAASTWKARILGTTSLCWLLLYGLSLGLAWRCRAWRPLLLLGLAAVTLNWLLYLPFLALFRHSVPTAPYVALTIGLAAGALGQRRDDLSA